MDLEQLEKWGEVSTFFAGCVEVEGFGEVVHYFWGGMDSDLGMWLLGSCS